MNEPFVIKDAFFAVKNFKKWQHYKKRNPPWIKLHRDLLNDYQFSCLQDDSKLHLIMIWLLASQSGNKLPVDSEWIAKKTNVNGNLDLKMLIDKGFLVVDSNVIAE